MRADSKIRFTYIRKNKNVPVGLVAWKVVPDPEKEGQHLIVAGASFCSKHDSFNKDYARFLAEVRLEKSPAVDCVPADASVPEVSMRAVLLSTRRPTRDERFGELPKWSGSSSRARRALDSSSRHSKDEDVVFTGWTEDMSGE
jgi:hypothetical protein